MQVVFDHQIFALQQHGGISRYFVEVARWLAGNSAQIEPVILAPFHSNEYLSDVNEVVKVLGRKTRIESRMITEFALAANKMTSPKLARDFRVCPDVIHETYYTRNPIRIKAPRVITVFDMIHELQSERLSKARRLLAQSLTSTKRQAIQRADKIFAISESTKRDLVALFGIPEERIQVTYLAHSHHFTEPDLSSNSRPLEQPYILFVGRRGWYKNFSLFIRGFAASRFGKTGNKIVAFGGGKFNSQELALIKQLGIIDQIIQIGGSDRDLAKYYGAAECFVFPSLYEGFGIPLLEAMASGCPVVCSRISCFKEIASDAAEYFDPQSHEEIATTVDSVISSETKKQKLTSAGRLRAKEFSWSRCAQETLDGYKDVLSVTEP